MVATNSVITSSTANARSSSSNSGNHPNPKDEDITPTTPVRPLRFETQKAKALRATEGFGGFQPPPIPVPTGRGGSFSRSGNTAPAVATDAAADPAESPQKHPQPRPGSSLGKKQSSVRFDLQENSSETSASSTNTSAFTAVERQDVSPPPKTTVTRSILLNPNTTTTTATRPGPYHGPVDVDEVSLSSTFSGGDNKEITKINTNNSYKYELDNDKFLWLPMTPLGSEASSKQQQRAKAKEKEKGLVHKSKNSSDSIEVDFASDDTLPTIKTTGATMDTSTNTMPFVTTNANSNTSRNDWLLTEKEPFLLERNEAPLSPTMSLGILGEDGKTIATTGEMESLRSHTLSPDDFDDNTEVELGQLPFRMTSSSSPPLSPLNLPLLLVEEEEERSDRREEVGRNMPPLSTLQLVTSGPTLATEHQTQSHLSLTSQLSENNLHEPKKECEEEENSNDELELANNTTMKSLSPTVASPPPIDRRTSWLQLTVKDPFQQHHASQSSGGQLPASPPVSNPNLTYNASLTSGETIVQEQSSSQLRLTKEILEEVDQRNQEKKQNNKAADKKKTAANHKNNNNNNNKISKQQQLQNAQQVVKVVLKGSRKFQYQNVEDETRQQMLISSVPSNDYTSPQACYHAIQHYAMIRLESSKLNSQLETSKQQLKDLYLQWKCLKEDIVGNNATSTTTTGNASEHGGSMGESMVRLTQMLSDDNSTIYKEEDDNGNDNETRALPPAVSFSLSKLDQETDPSKAMDALYHQMQVQIKQIHKAWKKNQEQQQTTTSTSTAAANNPTSSDDNPNRSRNDTEESSLWMEKIAMEDPFPQASDNSSDDVIFDINDEEEDEDNDAFLWSKIEELTAQIEAMEQDQAILTGFMDQLTEEVIKKDSPNLVVVNSFATNHDGDQQQGWTTFGKKFPVYQQANEQGVGDNTTETSNGEKVNVEAMGASTNNATQPADQPLALALRPGCMLLRAKGKFNDSSYDSDILPWALNRSHGDSSSNDGDLDASSQSDKPMMEWSENQLVKGEEGERDCGEKLSKVSPESPTKIDTGFYSRMKARLKSTKDDVKLPLLDKAPEHDEDNDQILTESYTLSTEQRGPPALNAELIRKLQSPLLETQLSLPRKITADDLNEEEGQQDALARPTSPMESEEQQRRAGYVWLSSRLMQTEQDLNNSRCQVSLLQNKLKHAELELTKAGYEIETWKNLASSAAEEGTSTEFASIKSEIENLLQKCNEEKVHNNEMKKGIIDLSEEVKYAKDHFQMNDEEPFERNVGKTEDDDDNKMSDEQIITKKVEECTRLMEHVKSLKFELEIQRAYMTKLEDRLKSEGNVAVIAMSADGAIDNIENPFDDKQYYLDQLQLERDENTAAMSRLAENLARKTKETEDLKALLLSNEIDWSGGKVGKVKSNKKRTSIRKKLLQMRFPSSRSLEKKKNRSAYKPLKPSKEEWNELDKFSARCGAQKMGSNTNRAISPIKVETVMSGSGSNNSALSEEDVSDHLSMKSAGMLAGDNSSSEKSFKVDASMDSDDFIIPALFNRNRSMDDAATREDAQIATIHGLMKRIEHLEEEKAELKAQLKGKHFQC